MSWRKERDSGRAESAATARRMAATARRMTAETWAGLKGRSLHTSYCRRLSDLTEHLSRDNCRKEVQQKEWDYKFRQVQPEETMRRIRQIAVVMLLLVLVGYGVGEWFAKEAAQALDPTDPNGPTGEDPNGLPPEGDPSDPGGLSPEEEHLATCTLEDDPSKITSKTFWIDVDISEQKVRIMEEGSAMG